MPVLALVAIVPAITGCEKFTSFRHTATQELATSEDLGDDALDEFRVGPFVVGLVLPHRGGGYWVTLMIHSEETEPVGAIEVERVSLIAPVEATLPVLESDVVVVTGSAPPLLRATKEVAFISDEVALGGDGPLVLECEIAVGGERRVMTFSLERRSYWMPPS